MPGSAFRTVWSRFLTASPITTGCRRPRPRQAGNGSKKTRFRVTRRPTERLADTIRIDEDPSRLSGDQALVGRQRQELDELVRERHLRKDLRRGLVAGTELLELLTLEVAHTLAADAPVPHPLPDLRPADLGSGGVLHQVVDRRRADPVQPRRDVLDADRDVEPDSVLCDTAGCRCNVQ